MQQHSLTIYQKIPYTYDRFTSRTYSTTRSRNKMRYEVLAVPSPCRTAASETKPPVATLRMPSKKHSRGKAQALVRKMLYTCAVRRTEQVSTGWSDTPASNWQIYPPRERRPSPPPPDQPFEVGTPPGNPRLLTKRRPCRRLQTRGAFDGTTLSCP